MQLSPVRLSVKNNRGAVVMGYDRDMATSVTLSVNSARELELFSSADEGFLYLKSDSGVTTFFRFFRILNTIDLEAGQFVHFSRTGLSLADCSDIDLYATHVVAFTDDPWAYLSTSADYVVVKSDQKSYGDLYFRPIYLLNDGKATDIVGLLRGSDGYLVDGVAFLQVVGWRVKDYSEGAAHEASGLPASVSIQPVTP